MVSSRYRTSDLNKAKPTSKRRLALSKNPDSHRRTKHIDVKYHLLREHVQKRTVALQFIGSSEMAADVLTKGLTPLKHKKAVELLGVGA